MESRARFLGHSIHQILIVFPLGLLMTSVGFDVAALVTRDSMWAVMAFYLIIVGVAGGVIAALFGLVDYLAIPPGTRARHIGLLHGLSNVIVVVIFSADWYLRRGTPPSPTLAALLLSGAGLVVAGIAGWWGGELVTRMGVGVADDAGVNAAGTALLSGRARSYERAPTASGQGAPER